MAHGTLANLKRSSYVRTDPVLATRIGKFILRLPSDPFLVCDPTCGTGSLFYACAYAPSKRLFGIEISAERAAECQTVWPQATILTTAFEAVGIAGLFDLFLVNPPYMLVNGKRASLRILTDCGEHLRPGGILVTILTARSDWDWRMIHHFLTWYDDIRVWKFPDRTSPDQEGAFEDFTQIVIVGVRRSMPTDPSASEKRRLEGYQWKEDERTGESGWRYGVAPPDLPDEMIATPYQVPSSIGHELPSLVVRRADGASLLHALKTSGAHLSPVWQQATTWPEEGYLGTPAMPYTGEAHIAAEAMVGGLDGEVVWPQADSNLEPHLFSSFVGQQWVQQVIDAEKKEELAKNGCVAVSMRELLDKPILGALNLSQGIVHYYQGEEVFDFLRPWLSTLSTCIVKRRKPLYRLDPAPWEMAVLSQFGLDKQLPRAVFPGLAAPQLHRAFAMGRALDVRSRTAIQGEPGTGKTRMATATASCQGYRWRYRLTTFKQGIHPAWERGLRRAWLKNPRTLSLLGLEPVYGWRINRQDEQRKEKVLEVSPNPRLIAYRELSTGRLIDPEAAGPAALPVIIATPLKVTKEYGNEIRAAFPEAEVVHLESHRDITGYFARCATSSAPVVFGIISHSSKQAFGRRWQPALQQKIRISRTVELHPDPALLPSLTPVHDKKKNEIVGYRIKGTDQLLTTKKEVTHFHCPDCREEICATPGHYNQAEQQAEEKRPVTSRTWFTTKQRWCSCTSRRNQERKDRGADPIRLPLWQEERIEATKRKYPSCSFAEWSMACSALREQANQLLTSTQEMVNIARHDTSLLTHLIEVALQEMPETMMQWASPDDVPLFRELAQNTEDLTARLGALWEYGEHEISEAITRSAIDDATLARLLAWGRTHAPTWCSQVEEVLRMQDEQQERLGPLVTQVITRIIGQDRQLLSTLLQEALCHEVVAESLLAAISAAFPHLHARLYTLRNSPVALVRVLSLACERLPAALSSPLFIMLREQETRHFLLLLARKHDVQVGQLLDNEEQYCICLASLLTDAVRQFPEARTVLFGEALQSPPFLVELAHRDLQTLTTLLPDVASCEEIRTLVQLHLVVRDQLVQRLVETISGNTDTQLSHLVEETRHLVNWQPICFRQVYEQAQKRSLTLLPRARQAGQASRTRLTVVDNGAIVSYQPQTSSASAESRKQVCFDFRIPPPDSFSPYDYLYRFFRGCVALAVIDESHNGRGQYTDIALAHRQAMRAAQTRMLTSGTHYGGDILGFYHYWFSFNPAFWQRLGFGWKDAQQALKHYGVIQEWTKEYEADARKGSGKSDIRVSTVPAPGLSAKLVPGLLEDLVYLTVLDVGAHMPAKKEIPKGILMRDPVLEQVVKEAQDAYDQAYRAVQKIRQAEWEAKRMPNQPEKWETLATLEGDRLLAEETRAEAKIHLDAREKWAEERDLAKAYSEITGLLEKKARKGNVAARLALGTIPRLFAALPCDSPFEVYSTKRGDWGDKGERQLVIRTPVLAWDYLYPLERRLIETVKSELAEERTVMIYIEQITRSMAKRVQWVLGQADIACWTLSHTVEAEDRQQVILDALGTGGHRVIIVPYRLVNEGINLQQTKERRGINTIIWFEQSMNLFMYLQASQRAWRLGAEKEVRIHLPFYLGTAAHSKMRKLGGQSGAAAAFAGEPAKGELIRDMGADQTTLARLSEALEEEALWGDLETRKGTQVEDELANIEAAFARRNDELAEAPSKGRSWIGSVNDTLSEQMAVFQAARGESVWARPSPMSVVSEDQILLIETLQAELSTPKEVREASPGEVLQIKEKAEEPLDSRQESPDGLEQQVPVLSPSQTMKEPEEGPLPTIILVFGNEDDIRSARNRRGIRPRRMVPRLKQPVTVKDIPAQEAQEVLSPVAPKKADVMVYSMWDMP